MVDPTTSPGGYVVILFTSSGNENCELDRCVMSAHWFASYEQAEAYMATVPEWTVPHRLPLMATPGEI